MTTKEYIQIELPKEFRECYGLVPIERCMTCDAKILESGEPYLIEKAYRRTRIVHEYALCIDCLQKMDESMSFPSRGMRDYWLNKHVRLEERFARISRVAPDDVVPWINRCAVTGRYVGTLDEYQTVALCQGTQLLLCGYPYMISSEAAEELNDLMSKETREEWDRFKGEYLDEPPAMVIDEEDGRAE
jgi:hypothetical protein